MEAFRLMELDHTLGADRDGSKLRVLRERLETGRRRLRSTLDAGVAGSDYQKVQAALGAYEAGLQLLPALWEAQRG